MTIHTKASSRAPYLILLALLFAPPAVSLLAGSPEHGISVSQWSSDRQGRNSWARTAPIIRSGCAVHGPLHNWNFLRLFSSEDDNDADITAMSGVDDFRRDSKWQERSKRWVIIVDDEEPIRKAVGQLLFDQGFQVTACADGPTVLQVAKSGRREDDGDGPIQPDVIVSDVRMPGMDGLELLERIRSDPKLMGVPVILLTAKGMTQDRIAGYNSGADAYLPKPFDPEELVTIIDNVIGQYEGLNGQNIQIDDLKQDLDEIKCLLIEKGGGGVGNGWVEKTNVFLAPDEREVLELLCQGLMNKEIAAKTFLSTRRVEQVLTSLFRKTSVKNRTELVRWAVSTGNVQI